MALLMRNATRGQDTRRYDIMCACTSNGKSGGAQVSVRVPAAPAPSERDATDDESEERELDTSMAATLYAPRLASAVVANVL